MKVLIVRAGKSDHTGQKYHIHLNPLESKMIVVYIFHI